MKQFGRLAILMAAMFSLALIMTACEKSSGGGGSDSAGSGDRAKIIGTWNVTTYWRWSQMTFHADGTRSVVERSSGTTLNRGTWHLAGGKLVVVSDVTELWSYTVTATTLTVHLPSGTTVQMVKVK